MNLYIVAFIIVVIMIIVGVVFSIIAGQANYRAVYGSEYETVLSNSEMNVM